MDILLTKKALKEEKYHSLTQMVGKEVMKIKIKLEIFLRIMRENQNYGNNNCYHRNYRANGRGSHAS